MTTGQTEQNCCCSWGAAIGKRHDISSGESPEFDCTGCPKHGGRSHEYRCKRHQRERKRTGFAVTTPCARCPFRSDVEPYLTFERAKEIAGNLRDSGVFHCHKTTSHDDDGMPERSGREQYCAGSLILQENDGQIGQMIRIAERLGLYDASQLDMDAPVPDSISEWVRRYRPADPTVAVDGEEVEFEHCGVVGSDCEDPAGYSYGGSVGENDDPPTCDPDDCCHECGQPMCPTCRATDETCVNCSEEEDL